LEKLTKENVLELIPEKGIPIISIMKKLGISIKEDKISARKVLSLLKSICLKDENNYGC